jgi:apolipoprotein N-acyltransferase
VLDSYPKLQLLTGFHGVKYYQTGQKPTRSARVSAYDPGIFYDVYNSALWLQKEQKARFYHKSKLVPGTEQMPFIHTIPFLESLAISLDENSITGSLGVSDSAFSLGKNPSVAPIICYESIYGDYVRGYLKSGATWLGIITNDAWWENTPGYKQHFSYACLRAIEFRKWIGRSANTGITGFIDPKGNAYQKTSWYQKVCVQQEIYANEVKTCYYYLGDLGFIGLYALISLCLWFFFRGRDI